MEVLIDPSVLVQLGVDSLGLLDLRPKYIALYEQHVPQCMEVVEALPAQFVCAP